MLGEASGDEGFRVGVLSIVLCYETQVSNCSAVNHAG